MMAPSSSPETVAGDRPRHGRIAIVGTVGLPPRYGGFETLAAALAVAAEERWLTGRLAVTCSAPRTPRPRPQTWAGATLAYRPFDANGPGSIAHDIAALLWAWRDGREAVLLLGVSGAPALPLLRRLSSMRVIVHVDGIEWQRPKWRGLARAYLKWAEGLAVRWADAVISDNPAITAHLRARYGRDPVEIAYGAMPVLPAHPAAIDDLGLPAHYALAIARIEPENSIEMLLTAYAELQDRPLAVFGNWEASSYGRDLKARFGARPNLLLRAAEYDPNRLAAIRARATLYVHGHRAGGTNPSLLEMMPYAIPILAYDCAFNRASTDGKAGFFDSAEGLRAGVARYDDTAAGRRMGADLADLAATRYRWDEVTAAYFDLLAV
jgi:glycosyltransferase involved in cell wall biosynthesis